MTPLRTACPALLVFALAMPPGAAAQPVMCENERGETYSIPLGEYRAGLRPYGPCYPLGTWRQHAQSACDACRRAGVLCEDARRLGCPDRAMP